MRSSMGLYDPSFLDVVMSNNIAGRTHKKTNKNKKRARKAASISKRKNRRIKK